MNELEERVEDAWAQSLNEIFKEVLRNLPDSATLGEIVLAARSSPELAPVLGVFSVQELIDLAIARPRIEPDPEPIAEDDDEPAMELGELGPAVIRRRADIPNGEALVLRALSRSKAGRRESDLLQLSGLAAEQLRLVTRHLRTQGHLHVEGSGSKRRYKITRSGLGYLRELS